MARSMTSLGSDSALALFTARRRRAFMLGSGRPALAATVISRESLENSLERAESARPLRCMMFLNFECPAMVPGKLVELGQIEVAASTCPRRAAEPPGAAGVS